MLLDVDEFIRGVKEASSLLEEDKDPFDVGNVALFPTIDKQTKWQFAKTPRVLRLSDGNQTFSFILPEEMPEDDEFEVERSDNPELQKEQALQKGLAQIHRADPGSIYFTLQEGSTNPTYTIRHKGGTKWQAIPKKRKKKEACLRIQKEAFIGGLTQAVDNYAFKPLARGVKEITNAGYHLGMLPGSMQPVSGALTGAALGGLYDIGKRNLYNTERENEKETAMKRVLRYLVPAVAVAGGGMLTRTMAPEYYKDPWKFGIVGNKYVSPGSNTAPAWDELK